MFGGRYMKENIPVLLLKKLTILPSQEVRIELNNELSKKVIDLSTIEFSNKVLIVLPSNTLEESPTITDLPKSGVLTLIKRLFYQIIIIALSLKVLTELK